MKKIKLIAASLLASTLVMSGCGKNDHQHTFAEEWSHDNEKHWHPATCEHTDVKGSEEAHKDENSDHKCDVCEFVMSECVDLTGDHKCDICGADLPYVSGVSISGAPETMFVGNDVTLRANVQAHSGASNKVTWSVDKADLASIDENGKLTAKALGTVVVTATSVADASKKASVSITIIARDWSNDDKESMLQCLGVVLPYFEGDFEWSADTKEGTMTAESENEEDAAKVVEAYDALQLPKVDYGLYVEYTLEGAEEGFAVKVQVGVTSSGATVFAYSYRYLWPTKELAAFTSEHTDEVVPAAEGEEFIGAYNAAAEAYVIDVYGGNLNSYLATLSGAGWLIADLTKIPQAGYYDAMSPKGNLDVVIFPYSDSYRVAVFLSEPLPTEWPAEELAAFIGEHSTDIIPVAEGKFFDGGLLQSGDYAIDVYGGDIQAYAEALELAGFEVKDFYESDGVYECTSSTYTLKVTLFDLLQYGYPAGTYEIQVELINPTPFPADAIAEFIGEHTDETVPVASGAHFDYFVIQGIFVFNVHAGNLTEYLSVLETANYSVSFDTEDEIYIADSEKGYLELVIVPDTNESYQVQIYKTEPPLAEWPAEEVAAFCEGYTEVEIPAASGDEFYVSALDPATSYGYFGYIQVIGGVYTDYLSTLETAGFAVDYDETNDFYFAIKGNLELDIFVRNGYFSIQAAVYVDPTVWPAETIASFLKGHTEVEVPAATGDSFMAQATTGYYYGQVIVFGGVVADYCSTLEGAGFEVAYDETNKCYTAHKGDLAIDVYDYSTYMGLGFYTYVAPVAEWPTEAIAELLNGKTEVTIPAAEGTSFVVEPLTDFYFGSITISGGDMDAYLETLQSAGFSITWDTKYQCYVAAKDNLLMDIGENPNVEGEFQMLLYLKAEFPTADVAAAVEALVPGSETVIPEFEADEYQLVDARYYIGAFVLYAVGDSSLLNEYLGILDEADWAVGELEEGVYGAVSPAEDIMLQIDYDSSEGCLEVYIMTYTKPSSEWPTDKVAALVELIEADGTVPACDGLSFVCYEPEGYYPAQINVSVEEGTAETALAAYIAKLESEGFFVAASGGEGYDYYAEEGKTLVICPVLGNDSTIVLILNTLASPAVKPLTEWPATEVASLVATLGAEGSTVPSFEGEGISFNTQEAVGDYGPLVKINAGSNNPNDLIAAYCAKLEGLGYFVADYNYGAPVYALEGETLGISPYIDYNFGLVVEFVKLDEPAHKTVEWPTDEVAALVEASGATGTAVPAFGGEFSNYSITSTPDMGGYYAINLVVGEGNETDAVASYISQLENLGYFVAGDNYGDPIYALEGETLGISTYTYEDDTFIIEILKLSEPAVKPVESAWPTSDIETYISTNELVGSVPEYAGEYSKAEFNDSWGIVDVYVTAGTENEAIAAYIEQLEGLGYFVAYEFDGWNYYAKEGDTLAFCPYSTQEGIMSLEFYTLSEPAVKPVTPEPPAELSELNSKYSTWLSNLGLDSDSLPEVDGIENVNSIDYVEDLTGTEYPGLAYFDVALFADSSNFDSIIAAYEAELEKAGWSGSYGNYSKGDLSLAIYGNGDHVLIDIMYHLPAEEVDFIAKLTEWLEDINTTATIPETFTVSVNCELDVYEYETEKGWERMEIDAYFDSSSDATTALSELKNMFTNAGWTGSSNDYTSPEGNVCVNFYKTGDQIYMTFTLK